jgi:tetratricopeptide (TPR) repeat protein
MKNKSLKVVFLIVFAVAVISGIGWQRRTKSKHRISPSSSSNSSTTKASSISSTSSTYTKINFLLASLKKDPTSALINNRLAYLYYSTKKYKQAEYYYKKSIVANSKNIEARLGLYNICMINKKYSQAATYCREVRSIDNLNYYGNLYHAYARMAQYNYKSAEATCKKMLKVYPCDKTFLGLLKLNYYYQKQTNNAKQIQTYLDMLR